MNVKSDLKLLFTGLVTQYPGVGRLFDSYWKEIVDAYSEAGRHYHTLRHLHFISQKLEACTQKPRDPEALLFCLFYHDLVYKPDRKDNEERSAETASLRMEGLGVNPQTIALCVKHILATKNHEPTGDEDTDLFCDADMAILGEDDATFREYCENVRKEYRAFPDKDYNEGRVAVLRKILAMDRIFKTAYFHDRFETSARANLSAEIARLGKD